MLKRRERELGFFTLQSFSQDDSVPLGLFRKVLCVSEAPNLVIAVITITHCDLAWLARGKSHIF